ncbi:MAG: glycosyltransferase family 4 protein [Candidatus Parcubacteria bacterium]|nr:glycosyltransferase family 4 protein [Burkholderiales bacterium]
MEHVPRVLIDITRLLYRRVTGRGYTGIDRVALEYLRHFRDRAHAVVSWRCVAAALSDADSRRAIETLLDARGPATSLGYRLAIQAWLWDWLRGPGANPILLDIGHTWLDNGAYAWLLRRRGARPVFFIHDLIPILHPEFCRPGEKARHVARMRNALRDGAGLIVNSRHTLAELERFAASGGLHMPPVVVAPLAPSVVPSASPGPRPIEQPFFVVLGTIEPRKNHLLLLQLWGRLAERLGDSSPRLVVVGQRGWGCEKALDLLERSEPLKGIVSERNQCGDAELANLLQHAQALLMPSFAEGYGLPVAEALAAGLPVIASDLPAFREIAGTMPEYADPRDGPRWEALVEDYSRPDSQRRQAQLRRIRDFRPTTWAQHFEEVDRFLERLDERAPA